MAENDTQPKTPTSSKQRDRSPSFPFISLKTAIERLVAFEKYFGRHPAPANRAGLAWGMKTDSSQANQTLAALKAFGLIDYEGTGAERKAHLTDDARTYLRAQQESIKQEVLKSAVLKPKQTKRFWKMWGADRPPSPVCLDELVLKYRFTENAAKTFLSVYDDTIAYAGLTDSDKVLDADENGDDTPEDENGNENKGRIKRRKVKPDMKEDVYTLKEGDVVFQWPERISVESYEDLKDWTKLILRKIERHIVTNKDEYETDEEREHRELHGVHPD